MESVTRKYGSNAGDEGDPSHIAYFCPAFNMGCLSIHSGYPYE